MVGGTVDRAPILVPPPLLFFLALGLTWGLDRWIPRSLGLSPRTLLVSGSALGLVSFLLAGWAWRVLSRAGTPVDPYAETVAVVDAGPFHRTRNPLYLALILLLLAFGVVMDSAWTPLSAAILLLALDRLVVVREEVYLEAKFGDPYRDYRRRVRRWL